VTGLITSATDANGNASQLTYNAWGNVIGAIDASATPLRRPTMHGRKAVRKPTRAGNTTRVHLRWTPGRLIQTTLADALLDRQTVRRPGQRHGRGWTPLGRRTTYVYDAMDRVISDDQPDGTTPSTTYNWRGQPLTATDQEAALTTYSYDLAGQLVKVTAADGSDHPVRLRRRRAQDQLDRSARPCHHLHLRQRGPHGEDPLTR